MPSSGSQTASGATQRVERTHRTRGGLVKMVFNERKRKWYDDNGRERDPRTGRCINKPKGPQGNKPQNVTGITASWDFGKADKTILSNVQREIQRLQAGLRRVTPLPYYVSDLKQTGWPWLCLIIVHQGIAVKMQIVIRGMCFPLLFVAIVSEAVDSCSISGFARHLNLCQCLCWYPIEG